VFDLQQIDLSSLMAGDSFTLACTLRKNGITVQARALCDTRASGYVFLDTSFVSDLCRTLGIRPRQLPYLIYPKGYNSKKGSLIS
jgi:hypothetical protein